MPGESTTLRFTFTSVDKSILGIILEEANAVPQDVIDSLVPSAKEFFENALAKAQEVYDDADATEEEVKEAWSDLLDAMHLLEFEAGDKETLLPLINIAEQLKDMLDQSSRARPRLRGSARRGERRVCRGRRPEGGRRRGI